MFPQLPFIRPIDWFAKHDGHNKSHEELVSETFLYTIGQVAPTEKIVMAQICCRCNDCNEVILYDSYQEKIKL